MSALSIQPTYPIFNETDGQPLENGYIWIGTVNLDPQTNPVQVYWDAAMTQLASQPIRTEGGYPVNAGTPARLYVNCDYSIRVMDKSGSIVFSALETTQVATTAFVATAITDERTATATLANKTLTSPTLTSPTLTSPTLSTPALGTPTSGTLTNCTGLPGTGVTDSSMNISKLDATGTRSSTTYLAGDNTFKTISTPTLSFGAEQFAYVQECSGSGTRTLKYSPPNVIVGVEVTFESGWCGRMPNYLGVYYRSLSIV